jgi:hypothetical protein
MTSFTYIEQVRNVLEVLRLVEQVDLTEEEAKRIRAIASQYLDELLQVRADENHKEPVA